ncbi:MAG: nicotinate-nucleotide adenylyltransferase [Ancalomicrobiaceae bacterium]|nr:nicotinate-nucleotide adenylyltransferase [Ancalomicrobiaceae bacterium]
MTAPISNVDPDDLKIPLATPGMAIGLLGGSFNPPHAGHLHVATVALARLGLDRLWMLVTPGNPLKERAGLPDLATRIEATRALARDPRIVVTGFEATLGSAYSWVTIRHLVRTFPRVNFVWVMGADNLAGFHRWQHWRRIATTVPLAIVDRPGSTLSAQSSPAAAALARSRLKEAAAATLIGRPAPAWVFLHARRNELSSSRLRAEGRGL